MLYNLQKKSANDNFPFTDRNKLKSVKPRFSYLYVYGKI